MIKYVLPLVLISDIAMAQAYCNSEKCCTVDGKCLTHKEWLVLETIERTTRTGGTVPVFPQGSNVTGRVTIATNSIIPIKESFQGKPIQECVIISGSPIIRYVIAGCKTIIMEGEEAK